jgi:hypothetical protein|tara:strand:- start:153 stop:593 length:441 start_codon:yes stop_codon:yes gene_type:complete
MKLISHRGNLEGPNPERENHPDYIYEAIQAGYDVEIDIWFVDGKFKLGHDEPQYDFPFDLFSNFYTKLWIHCKNIEALSQLNNLDSNGSKLNYFFHESDLGVLTSKGYIWSTNQCERGILVMPETFNQETNENTFGVCSDYIKNYG